MGKQLYKATAIVSSMTLFSRLLGFVRDMLIAGLFGVDFATDAFFVAFKMPNFLRRLFAEGAFSHALVPVLTHCEQQEGQAALKILIGKIAGNFLVWGFFITLMGILLAPLLVLVLAPGFAWQGKQYELTIDFLQIVMPYGVFVILVAFCGAILNAHERFAIPALTPVLLNIVMILAAVWLAPLLAIPITALSWGVLIAGFSQLIFQIPSLLRLGLLPKPSFQFKDPVIRKINQLLLPAIFSSSITQINLLLDTLIASFLASGSVSWLYYSDRLVEFPLGILGMALGTVILPNLAKNHLDVDPSSFSTTLDWGLRCVLLIGLPATLGLIMLAEPLLSTLFQYHEFTASDVHMAGLSLKAYSLGLLGFLFIKILVPAFTARQDLKTPVRLGLFAMFVSLVLNLLAIPFAHAGLALATSLGALINALLLLITLVRERIYKPGPGWWGFILRLFIASLCMTLCLGFFVDTTLWNDWHSFDRITNLLKWVLLSCLIYAVTLRLCGLRLRHLMRTSGKINRF